MADEKKEKKDVEKGKEKKPAKLGEGGTTKPKEVGRKSRLKKK